MVRDQYIREASEVRLPPRIQAHFVLVLQKGGQAIGTLTIEREPFGGPFKVRFEEQVPGLVSPILSDLLTPSTPPRDFHSALLDLGHSLQLAERPGDPLCLRTLHGGSRVTSAITRMRLGFLQVVLSRPVFRGAVPSE